MAFDAKERASYYERVFRTPPPRWTARDQRRYRVKTPDYVPMTATDRGFASPIRNATGKGFDSNKPRAVLAAIGRAPTRKERS